MNNCSSNLDGVASNDEINEAVSNDELNEGNEIVSNDEINGIDRVGGNDEINRRNEIDSENKDGECVITDKEKDETKKNTDETDTRMSTIQRVKEVNRSKKAITYEKTVRRSERIRKQRYDIHPDDIGNNDDENYK